MIERLHLIRPRVKSIFLTTEKEIRWILRFHGDSKKLLLLPNILPFQASSPLIANPDDCVSTAYVDQADRPTVDVAVLASLNCWVNRKMVTQCFYILSLYQRSRQNAPRFNLHLYGTTSDSSHLSKLRSSLGIAIQNHGIIHVLNHISRECHFALLPNLIGRGFQNKLFSMLSTGILVIVDETMIPFCDRELRPEPSSLVICSSKAQYLASIDQLLSGTVEEEGCSRVSVDSYLLALRRETQCCFAVAGRSV